MQFIEEKFKPLVTALLGFMILLLLSIKMDTCQIKNDNSSIKRKTKELSVESKSKTDSLKIYFNESMDEFLKKEKEMDSPKNNKDTKKDTI